MAQTIAETKETGKIFIVTGMSGAGKSQALKCFEDFGYYCIDNLPVGLFPAFAKQMQEKKYLRHVALGVDIREGRYVKNFNSVLDSLIHEGYEPKIIFLDATDEAIVRRFSETRHRHPLGKTIQEAIKEERAILSGIKTKANRIIDTTKLKLGELKEIISGLLEVKQAKEMQLSVVSFGYKHGLPLDADIVMDVRFLPNPYYVPELKEKTGLDKEIRDYLDSKYGCKQFLNIYTRQLMMILPLYIKEGKSYLTIAIGCTGGHHRSVYVASQLAKKLLDSGYSVSEYHRDIRR